MDMGCCPWGPATLPGSRTRPRISPFRYSFIQVWCEVGWLTTCVCVCVCVRERERERGKERELKAKVLPFRQTQRKRPHLRSHGGKDEGIRR